MAFIPVVSGGSQPVFATDVLNGSVLSANSVYQPIGTPVNFQGPKLDFFGLTIASPAGVTGNVANQAQVNGGIQQILQSIQQTATVAMYQADAVTGNVGVNLSVAVYPTGAYTAATLQAQIQALGNIQITNGGVTTGFPVGNTVVTNVGFRLASTASSQS